MDKIYVTLIVLIGIELSVILFRKLKLNKIAFCLQSLLVLVLAAFLNRLFQVDLVDKTLKITENFRPVVEMFNELAKWALSILFTLGLVLTFSKRENATCSMINVVPNVILISLSFVVRYVINFSNFTQFGNNLFNTAILSLLLPVLFIVLFQSLSIIDNYKKEFLISLVTVLALIGAVLPQVICGLVFVSVYTLKRHLINFKEFQNESIEQFCNI